MITIDLIDEHQARAEKLAYRNRGNADQIDYRHYHAAHILNENRREELLRAAQAARLLQAAKRNAPAIDRPRLLENIKAALLDLAARTARRIGYSH